MEEEELDIWFEEEKEKITSAYNKGVARTLVSEEFAEDKKLSTLTAEEREQLKDKAEKEYLAEISRLRERYRKEYDRIKSKAAAKKHASTAKETLLRPFSLIFGPAWRGIRRASAAAGKAVKLVFGTLWRGVKRIISDARYKWKNLYLFYLRKPLAPLLWVKRKFKVLFIRPAQKDLDAFKEKRKAFINKTRTAAVKAFTKGLGIAKTVWGKVMERYKKIAAAVAKVWKVVSAILKKLFGPLFSVIGKLLARFKKKDDEEEE